MVIGAHYGEEVVTSDKVQEMGQQGLKLLDEMMDQKLRELQDDAKEAAENAASDE